MKIENNNTDYDTRYTGASIRLHYKGQSCSTGVLPTSLPAFARSQTVNLETRDMLKSCWLLDISGGDVESMRMELRVPPNSPISVSKVKVIDDTDPSRCWKARWRNSNHNKVHVLVVNGTDLDFDDDCQW